MVIMYCREADIALAAVASNNIITLNKVFNTLVVAIVAASFNPLTAIPEKIVIPQTLGKVHIVEF